MKTIKMFGYNFDFYLSIYPSNMKTEKEVKRILDERLQEINKTNSKESKKISLIKVLRRHEVSKLLIDAKLVETVHINDSDTNYPFVGLSWAKNWVENNYSEKELTNNE